MSELKTFEKKEVRECSWQCEDASELFTAEWAGAGIALMSPIRKIRDARPYSQFHTFQETAVRAQMEIYA